MNKSKFLKKSLAMLLALMLVVAMIPLSASAAGALPNLDRLYIDGYPVTAEDGVFAFDIGENDEKDPAVDIKIDAKSLGTTEGTASAYIVKGDTVYNENLAEGIAKTIDLSEWGTEADGVVTLTLRVWSHDKTDSKDYTIELTRTTDSRVAKVESVSAGDGTYKASFVDNAGTNNIYMDVARYAMNQDEGAVLYVTPAEDGVVDNAPKDGGAYVINVRGDKQTFTITSQSGSVHSEYTIYVTVYDALQTLDINEVAAEITDTDGDGVKDKVTVTLPESMARDELGYALDNVKLPMNFTVYGDSVDLTLTPDGGTATPFKSGEKIELGKLVDKKYTAKLTLDAAGYDNLQEYALEVKLEPSTNTAIERVQMDEQLLTEVEGTDISVSVPANPANTNLAAMDVILFTKPDVVSISGFERAWSNKDDAVYGPNTLTDDGYVVWVADNGASGQYTYDKTSGKITDPVHKTFNMTKGLIVTVTSEADTTQQYTLRAKPEENRTVAQLKGLILQSPDGTNYEGNIVDHKVVFDDIPYMTVNVAGWKVFAKTNDAATAKYNKDDNYDTTIINGTTTAGAIGFDDTLNTKKEGKNETYIQVENMNDPTQVTEYHVEIVLPDPKMGNTLNNIDFHALVSDTGFTNKNNDQVYALTNTDNLVKTEVESESRPEYNTGEITLKPAYSLSSKNNEVGAKNIYNIVNSFATNNSGVAYLVEAANSYVNDGIEKGQMKQVNKLETLVSNKAGYDSDGKEVVADEFSDAAVKVDDHMILVLPEEIARQVDKAITEGANNDYCSVDQVTTGYGVILTNAAVKAGTLYTLKEEPQEKHQNAGLQTISVGSSKLTVGTDNISGTLAFSNTVDAGTVNEKLVYTGGEGEFVTFRTDDNFAIISVDADASKTSYQRQLISGGDTDGNGEPDRVLAGNQQLIFVREDDNKVSVYAWAGDGQKPVAIKGITVLAEDRLNGDTDITSKFYSFKDLKWQAPETKAEITSFTLAGRTGKITSTSDTLGTIDVTVPFNTDLKGLVATFTTSLGAKVVTADGVAMESGKTSLNYNEPVELEVTSEDTHHTKTFTVTVTASNQFDDVTTDKWYYDEVMDAANRGWVNGQGDGIFNPNGDMKRGDFALIVARIMGYNENEFAETVFPDVANDDYYCAAIAFCKQKGLIDGDDKGYFNPEDSITREQMAKIICNARGLTQVSDPVKVYSDDAKIANWAKGYVYACQAEGIMAGEEAVNMFYPKDNASRAEAAAVLVRAFA